MALSPGAIAGTVVACIFGLILLLALLAVIFLVRLRRSSDTDHSVGFSLPLGPVIRLFTPDRRAQKVQSPSAPDEEYQWVGSGGSPPNFGSMQVKGIRDVYGDREIGGGK